MLILVLQSGCKFGSRVLLLRRDSFDDCCSEQFAKSSCPGLAKLSSSLKTDRFYLLEIYTALCGHLPGFIAAKFICSRLTLCLDLLEPSSWEGAFSQDFYKGDNMHNIQY